MALRGGPGSGPKGMTCVTHKRTKSGVMRCAKFEKLGSRRRRKKSKRK